MQRSRAYGRLSDRRGRSDLGQARPTRNAHACSALAQGRASTTRILRYIAYKGYRRAIGAIPHILDIRSKKA
jgi:hypothetical protein